MAWPQSAVSDDQIDGMRKLVGSAHTNSTAILGRDTLALLFEIVLEVQHHREADRPRRAAEYNRDRGLVAQVAATMAGDRGCAPLGTHAAGEYVTAARALLAAVDASYAEKREGQP